MNELGVLEAHMGPTMRVMKSSGRMSPRYREGRNDFIKTLPKKVGRRKS